MIEFHRVTIDDIGWINERLCCDRNRSCEYSFGNIFGYDAVMKIFVADYENCLVTKCVLSDDAVSYCFPIGNGDIKKAFDAVLLDAKNSGAECDIFGLTKENAEFVNSNYGGVLEAVPDRDAFDYVYLSTDLISLAGKKYQPKRNHISYFKRSFNWTYETISRKNIPECLAMSERWLLESESEYKDSLENELKIIKRVFDNYEALGFVGGLIRVDGKVIAYTMGERLSKVSFCVHFEKAFASYRGAYPIINQQFVENELSSFTYINREDDVGAENLRKAKLSYQPAFLLEKYSVRLS